MKTRLFVSPAVVAISAVLQIVLVAQSHASDTWTGGGTPVSSWSAAANWGGTAPVAGDDLFFDGSTQLTTLNDFAATTAFGNITFATTAGGFTNSGNSITLNGNITNNSTTGQTNA